MATAQDDLEAEKKNWHWRNSMRPVRFFNLDARCALPFFILLVYARPVTFALTLLIVLFFWLLERRGLTSGAHGRYRPAGTLLGEQSAWTRIVELTPFLAGFAAPMLLLLAAYVELGRRARRAAHAGAPTQAEQAPWTRETTT